MTRGAVLSRPRHSGKGEAVRRLIVIYGDFLRRDNRFAMGYDEDSSSRDTPIHKSAHRRVAAPVAARQATVIRAAPARSPFGVAHDLELTSPRPPDLALPVLAVAASSLPVPRSHHRSNTSRGVRHRSHSIRRLDHGWQKL